MNWMIFWVTPHHLRERYHNKNSPWPKHQWSPAISGDRFRPSDVHGMRVKIRTPSKVLLNLATSASKFAKVTKVTRDPLVNQHSNENGHWVRWFTYQKIVIFQFAMASSLRPAPCQIKVSHPQLSWVVNATIINDLDDFGYSPLQGTSFSHRHIPLHHQKIWVPKFSSWTRWNEWS